MLTSTKPGTTLALLPVSLFAIAALTLALPPGRAWGDDWQPVQPDPGGSGANVTVSTAPTSGTNGGGGSAGSGSGGDSPTTEGDCHYVFLSSDNPPGGAEVPGAWYTLQCSGDSIAGASAAVWIADSNSTDPAVLARTAVSRLSLSPPAIRLNPAADSVQLTYLPTWMWLEADSVSSVSATASVPGLSVTATATATDVEWKPGDGTTVVCQGAGTPWKTGTDPTASSPTCGHTYTTASDDQPGGTFTVRTTVTWEITWVGGGTSGSVDPMTTTASTAARVIQSSALNS